MNYYTKKLFQSETLDTNWELKKITIVLSHILSPPLTILFNKKY